MASDTAATHARGGLATAWSLGLVHAVVDTASLAILNHEVHLYYEAHLRQLVFEDVVALILVYNAVAFGLQAPLGWVSDRFRSYKLFAVVGLALVVPAVVAVGWWPWAAAVTVALGNALFHVGAGAIVLRASGGRATAPGIFVGPGALGVCAGTWLGLAGFPGRILFALAVAACMVLVALVRAQPSPSAGGGGAPRPRMAPGAVVLSVALLCVSVAVRALTGGTIRYLPSAVSLGLILAAAAAGGKILGGCFADRFGWRVVGVGSLLAAAALVGLAGTEATIAVAAFLLIQLTMAVTLTAIYVAMPSRPGLAFGLPSLALLIGAAPGLARQAEWVSFDLAGWLLPLVLISAVTIYVGLSLLPRPASSRPGGIS